MDPAAAADEVLRRYPLESFSDAWLSHRGGTTSFRRLRRQLQTGRNPSEH